MNNPLNPKRWSPLADYALLIGSGAGAVASIATQNAAAATVPMTALVAMGLLNRRRIDRYLKYSDENLAILEGQVVTEISILNEQISALPTPETLNQIQRSAMAYSDRAITQFSEVLNQTQHEMHRRLGELESPDLSHLYQDVAQLQDQYTYACTTIANLSKQLERLSHLPRVEATEADVSQLKTEIMQLRVNLETFGSESKTAQATLQDAVRHLDRRLRQLPSGSDPNMLKGEVRELVRAVSDLVPRREFTTLSEKMQTLQDSQESLQQTLDRLRSAQDNASQNGHVETAGADLKSLQAELLSLTENFSQMEGRLEDIAVPFDITSEIRGTTATYLSGLQWQLAVLEQQTQELQKRQSGLVDALPEQLTPGQPQSQAAANENLQWLTALRGESDRENLTAIDRALFQALDEVSERLVVVWPWSTAISLDKSLVERFTEILEKGCRLEIGWCHPGDRYEGRLLKIISQQWHLTTAQRQLLKSTLNQLLPLKQKYPNLFSFKILGTDEQFLVCDRDYAIVGLEALPASSSTFPTLDLRLKTTDDNVIEKLLYRFDNPDALPEDAAAYFNRAVTRYDLRDPNGAIGDFNHVLRLNPEDAIALNNRGLIWAEKKQHQRALEDFDAALKIDNQLYAAYCNRGWVLMNQGEAEAAIANFDQAIQANPASAIPYFYRGTTRQRMGDTANAISDFTQAIQKNNQIALPYCYRGAAYQHQDDIIRAIADLETAASLLHGQGDHRSLSQVTQVLSELKQTKVSQPLELHSA